MRLRSAKRRDGGKCVAGGGYAGQHPHADNARLHKVRDEDDPEQDALTGCGRGSRRSTARLDIKAERQCIMGVYTRMMIGTGAQAWWLPPVMITGRWGQI